MRWHVNFCVWLALSCLLANLWTGNVDPWYAGVTKKTENYVAPECDEKESILS